MLNISEFSRLWENLEFWLVDASKLFFSIFAANIAITKHCWIIKLGKVNKNTFPDKSGNPESLKK